MAYNFTRLSEVPEVEEFPEGAKVLIEDEGEIKRAPGGGGSDIVLVRITAWHQELSPTTNGLTNIYADLSITNEEITAAIDSGKQVLIAQDSSSNLGDAMLPPFSIGTITKMPVVPPNEISGNMIFCVFGAYFPFMGTGDYFWFINDENKLVCVYYGGVSENKKNKE